MDSRSEELRLEEVKRIPRATSGAHSFPHKFSTPFLPVPTPESAAFETVLRHRSLVLEAIRHRQDDQGLTSEEERLAEAAKEVWWERKHTCEGRGGGQGYHPGRLAPREEPAAAERLPRAEPSTCATRLLLDPPNEAVDAVVCIPQTRGLRLPGLSHLSRMLHWSQVEPEYKPASCDANLDLFHSSEPP